MARTTNVQLKDEDLVGIIENEVTAAIGSGGAGSGLGSGNTVGISHQLAIERAMELDYYNSKPFGNEREGESTVVTSDVFDAVESALPHLLKTFTASDDVVEFQPNGPEDDEQAKQRTEVCNYVFYRQNNGFVKMYEWFKDALLQKNGIVKYWWEDKTDVTEDEYEGITEGEYLTLQQDKDVQILEAKSYDDPSAVEQKDKAIGQLKMQAQQNPQALQVIAQLEQQPVPKMYDCKIKTTKDGSKICIETVPPEEFGISAKHKCITIQDAPFVFQKNMKSMSDLKAMGCPDNVLEEITAEDSGSEAKPEVLARNRFIDEATRGTASETDPSLNQVWVVDCYLRIDYDNDGIAELRHFIMASKTIWINEPAAHIPFAAITPIIMPHRFVGKSYAELVMDIQFNTSVLLRQMFNNLYLTNNPQKVVLGSAGGVVQADLDRLLTSRVGGILVEYTPNAIRNQEVPFVAGASFPMLEYLTQLKEQRTGNTRYNQGSDADSLNKTAHGIALIQQASQQKIDLVARIFAETGVKDLFRGIAYMLSKYSTKAMTIRLRGKWVDIDPRQWKTEYDMTVNVGLGTGNKDAQLAHLDRMHATQIELMQVGKGYMVTDQNLYNVAVKRAEYMGFKHPDMFLTDPTKVKAPPPAPNPDLLKVQQADSEAKMKIQSTEKVRQFDAQTQKEIEAIKSQTAIEIAKIKAASNEKIVQLKSASDVQIEVFKANANLNNEKNAMQVEKGLMQLSKNIDNQQLTKAVEDVTGSIADNVKNAVTPVADAIQQHSAAIQQVNQSASVANQTAAQLKAQQDAMAQQIQTLSKAQVNNDKVAKRPRKHEVKKTADGYEITSVPT